MPIASWLRRQFRRLTRTRTRTCADCGFLAYGQEEATATDRVLLRSIETGSSTSPSGPVDRWDCAKHLWQWELLYHEPNWEAVFSEVAHERRDCRGFRKWKPGSNPARHFDMERETADFKRQLVLRLIPLLYGSIGAMIGAVLAWLWK